MRSTDWLLNSYADCRCAAATPVEQTEPELPFIPELPFDGFFLDKVRGGPWLRHHHCGVEPQAARCRWMSHVAMKDPTQSAAWPSRLGCFNCLTTTVDEQAGSWQVLTYMQMLVC